MKENNLQKKPRDAREYANLFLLDENGKKKDFSNVKNVCLITIGYAETTWILLEEFAGKDVTIIDRKSEIDYIETLIKLHKRNDIRIIRKIEVETDEEALSTILKLNMNMNTFDLIIANPPYGKIGTQILQKLQTLAPQVVALEQSADIKRDKLFQYIDKIEGPHSCFEDAKVIVYAFSLKNKKVHSMDWETWSADYRYDKNVAPFYKKNFARKEPWKYHCWESEEEWRRLFNEDKTFLLTVRTVFDGVHSGEDALDVYWNKKHICKFTPGERTTGGFSSIDKQGRYAAQGYEFETKEEKENIINWWYNSKIASKLCWGLKKQSFGRGYLPRVDWSRPWTDSEILKELGLPEDFLGE